MYNIDTCVVWKIDSCDTVAQCQCCIYTCNSFHRKTIGRREYVTPWIHSLHINSLWITCLNRNRSWNLNCEFCTYSKQQKSFKTVKKLLVNSETVALMDCVNLLLYTLISIRTFLLCSYHMKQKTDDLEQQVCRSRRGWLSCWSIKYQDRAWLSCKNWVI